MQLELKNYPVEVLLNGYQVSGSFTPRGNPGMFINDQAVPSFDIGDATMVPMMAGARIGEMQSSQIYVSKAEIEVLIIGNYSKADAALRPKPLRIILFTGSYAIRATFHVGAETNVSNVFGGPGPFFPATDAEIFTITTLAQEVHGEADLLFVNKSAVRTYYSLE